MALFDPVVIPQAWTDSPPQGLKPGASCLHEGSVEAAGADGMERVDKQTLYKNDTDLYYLEQNYSHLLDRVTHSHTFRNHLILTSFVDTLSLSQGRRM